MAYIVSHTGKNGVKAYASFNPKDMTRYTFTFAKEEAYSYFNEETATFATQCFNENDSVFMHDVYGAKLPSGLKWEIEKI